jgi:hypothetical protein
MACKACEVSHSGIYMSFRGYIPKPYVDYHITSIVLGDSGFICIMSKRSHRMEICASRAGESKSSREGGDKGGCWQFFWYQRQCETMSEAEMASHALSLNITAKPQVNTRLPQNSFGVGLNCKEKEIHDTESISESGCMLHMFIPISSSIPLHHIIQTPPWYFRMLISIFFRCPYPSWHTASNQIHMQIPKPSMFIRKFHTRNPGSWYLP